ncbi:unnamed protein product [Owenia fusiformis]|uniref:STAS domain-containing protein n=1 Tax=Owenia fusiformis TaxID=6347 RepID=A0A8S4NRA0_OWEFU|nr:unnamed protein product [Owenia fusiformis]
MNGTQGPSDGMQEYNKRLVEYQIATACSVTLLVAFMQLGMGILRLGFLTIYLSDPLISGFTTGAAFHVLTSQVKHMFGLNPGRYYGAFKLIRTWIDLFTQIPQTNFGALITTVVCVIGLVLVKECINARFKDKLKMPVPIELIVVIVGTAVSHFAKFNERFDMKIVGSIPTGIPPPKAPPMNRMGEFVGDAFATAIVAFAITISMAKIFAKKHDYEVDSNQELIAGGIVNGVSSFFSCYVTAASLSRSLIQDTVGGVTQVVGLVSCVLILVVLLALGPLFESLPNCVLAAIILVALKGMFKQFTELHRLWNVCKVDFMVWLVTWACTVFLDVDLGLIIGVGFSLLTVVFRTQRPHTCILGRVAHTDLYRDVQMYNGLKEIPGVKIFRFEASLYYASREHFKDKLYEQTMCNPRKIKQQRVKIQRKIDNAIKDEKNKFKKSQKTKESTELTEFNREDFEIRIKGEYPMPSFEIHHIIIDCSTMGYIDSVGVTALTQTINEYKEADVTIFLAHCKGNVREMLHRAGFFDRHDRGMIFPTTHDAVLHALDNYQDVKADVISGGYSKVNEYNARMNGIHDVKVNPEVKVTPDVMDETPKLNGGPGSVEHVYNIVNEDEELRQRNNKTDSQTRL